MNGFEKVGLDYNGKHVYQNDENYFTIVIDKNDLEYLHLLLNFCVDLERIKKTKQTQFFFRKLKEEVNDVVCGGM